MKQLSGLDATFLHLETAEMPMHVGALHVFELPAGQRGRFATRLRQHMAQRLPLAPVLRRKLWWMPLNLANPAWVDAVPDLARHIVEIKLPPSARQGDGMAELQAAVASLHPHLLDRSRPLWKMHVLEGLAPGANGQRRVGLYTQFHHAAVDGQAAVALAQVILDLQAEGRDLALRPSRRAPQYRLGLGEMLRGALAQEVQQVAHLVRQLPATASALAGTAGVVLKGSDWLRRLQGKPGRAVGNLTLAPRTVFNQSIGGTRSYATACLPLPALKALGKAHGATLNDLALLLCGTALRQWLAGQPGGVPRKSLVAAVPISLRAKGDTTADNQASMSLVSLGTHLADLGARLAHVKSATAAMKATMGGLKQVLPTDFPSIGVPWLLQALTALYGKAHVADRIPVVANVVISNVPGPPVPLYMAGARMLNNFPTSIVVHGLALNITVQSYDQQMDFGLIADGQAVPDVQGLADALQAAMQALQALPASHPQAAAVPAGRPVPRSPRASAARREAQAVSPAGPVRSARPAKVSGLASAAPAAPAAPPRSRAAAPARKRSAR